jgi:exosortase H (IPTLxxWG-CTERM-specific)
VALDAKFENGESGCRLAIPMKNPRVLFIIKFVAIIVVLYVVIAIHPVNDHVIVPFTERITGVAAVMLKVMGEKVTVSGTTIRSALFAVNVENGCNGIEAIILLVAAIAAFPAKWVARIGGIIGGFMVIQVLNIFRVAMLFWLGEHHPDVFQMFHVAVWQTLIVLASVGIFLIWSWRFAAPELADGR